MMKLWGRANSTNVQKVMLCLHELNVPFERIEAGMAFGVVGTPGYQAMNPNALVPTIDDDGFVLWESNVIVRYLCAKFAKGTYWPEDVAARADVERWMDWQQTVFGPAVRVPLWGMVRTPDKFTAEQITAGVQACEASAAILDALFSDRDFVGGKQFGMADIVLLPAAHIWLNVPVARQPRPHVEAWYARAAKRPAVSQVLKLPIT